MGYNLKMERIDNIDDFFDKYIFEETPIYSFHIDNNNFIIVLEDPIIAEQHIYEGKNERGFIQLTFTNINGYERKKGINTLYEIINFYSISSVRGTIDVQELTVGYGERTNKKEFFLYMGISYGEISFCFEDIYIKKIEAYYKKENNIDLYFDKKSNIEVDFYNPFNIDFEKYQDSKF